MYYSIYMRDGLKASMGKAEVKASGLRGQGQDYTK